MRTLMLMLLILACLSASHVNSLTDDPNAVENEDEHIDGNVSEPEAASTETAESDDDEVENADNEDEEIAETTTSTTTTTPAKTTAPKSPKKTNVRHRKRTKTSNGNAADGKNATSRAEKPKVGNGTVLSASVAASGQNETAESETPEGKMEKSDEGKTNQSKAPAEPPAVTEVAVEVVPTTTVAIVTTRNARLKKTSTMTPQPKVNTTPAPPTTAMTRTTPQVDVQPKSPADDSEIIGSEDEETHSNEAKPNAEDTSEEWQSEERFDKPDNNKVSAESVPARGDDDPQDLSSQQRETSVEQENEKFGIDLDRNQSFEPHDDDEDSWLPGSSAFMAYFLLGSAAVFLIYFAYHYRARIAGRCFACFVEGRRGGRARSTRQRQRSSNGRQHSGSGGESTTVEYKPLKTADKE